VHCTKISPELEFGVKGQRSKSPGTNKTKKCGILFGSRPLGRGPDRKPFFSAAVLAGAATPVGKSAHAV